MDWEMLRREYEDDDEVRKGARSISIDISEMKSVLVCAFVFGFCSYACPVRFFWGVGEQLDCRRDSITNIRPRSTVNTHKQTLHTIAVEEKSYITTHRV